MYLITVYNSGHPTVVHGDYAHVADCQIAKEVNATDSMTFTIYPGNPGYDALVEFATIIECIDVSTGDAVFQGACFRQARPWTRTALRTKASHARGFADI